MAMTPSCCQVRRQRLTLSRAAPTSLPRSPCDSAIGSVSRPAGDISSPFWRWQDGLVVQAMKHGWWVLLDEVNLAEPQILERLNSVLERDPKSRRALLALRDIHQQRGDREDMAAVLRRLIPLQEVCSCA